MATTASSGYISPPARVTAFLRDFLPEQNLQLLFPLGSFLLLLGASNFWFKLEFPAVAQAFHAGLAIDRKLLEQLTHSIIVWVSLEGQFAHLVVRFAFFASVVLWTLAVRKPVSKFVFWVVLPAACALAGYAVFLIWTAGWRHEFFDAFARSASYGSYRLSFAVADH